MFKSLALTLGVVCCWTAVVFGQAVDTPFQVHDATNLQIGDARITMTNSGAFSTVAFPSQNGKLCGNVYSFAASTGRLVACCSCLIAPNALRTLSVKSDLIFDAGLFPTPDALTVKLVSSAPTGSPLTCNAGTVGTGANVLVPGLLAWMTEPQPGVFGTILGTPETKTAFLPATLSAAELFGTTAQCQTLHPAPHACPSCP